MTTPMSTLHFNPQVQAEAHELLPYDALNDAELVKTQESCSGFWNVAMIIAMFVLAIFGVILAIEWPALMIPASIIIGGHLLVELGYLISRSCCSP
jgi:hypothetical protein